MKEILPEGVKEIVKTLAGITRGVEWEIVVYLTDDGQYYSEVSVKMKAATEEGDDLNTAVGFGAERVVGFLDDMGVWRAS